MALDAEPPEPEQLHRDLEELIVDGYARMRIDREPALALIRADRNAVRLALLDELDAESERFRATHGCSHGDARGVALVRTRAKYEAMEGG